MIHICSFHVLSNLLMIYICKLHCCIGTTTNDYYGTAADGDEEAVLLDDDEDDDDVFEESYEYDDEVIKTEAVEAHSGHTGNLTLTQVMRLTH